MNFSELHAVATRGHPTAEARLYLCHPAGIEAHQSGVGADELEVLFRPARQPSFDPLVISRTE